MEFRDYFLKQLNSADQQIVLNSIYEYMANETHILENAAAYLMALPVLFNLSYLPFTSSLNFFKLSFSVDKH